MNDDYASSTGDSGSDSDISEVPLPGQQRLGTGGKGDNTPRYTSQTDARQQWEKTQESMMDYLETAMDEERRKQAAVEFLGEDSELRAAFLSAFKRDKTQFFETTPAADRKSVSPSAKERQSVTPAAKERQSVTPAAKQQSVTKQNTKQSTKKQVTLTPSP